MMTKVPFFDTFLHLGSGHAATQGGASLEPGVWRVLKRIDRSPKEAKRRLINTVFLIEFHRKQRMISFDRPYDFVEIDFYFSCFLLKASNHRPYCHVAI